MPPDDVGPWEPVVRASPRRWWHLLYNPVGTSTLAAQTLVERLYGELRDPSPNASAQAARVAESEALVSHLAETAVPSSWREPMGWEWRIVVRDGADDAEWYMGSVPSSSSGLSHRA